MSNKIERDFLQSKEWRKFQEAVGRKTFNISSEGFSANIIEHALPIVGKYFYIPRGPIICYPELDSGSNLGDELSPGIRSRISARGGSGMTNLIDLAKKEKAGWIRFDANDSRVLDNIRKYSRVVKAPHDMQPKEVFVMDITKPEEELLGEMKSKTRYNIRLAEKHGVKIVCFDECHPELASPVAMARDSGSNMGDELSPGIRSRISARDGSGMTTKYLEEFLRLVKITSERNKITPHPENYYRKMFEVIPSDILKLYVAEYEGKIIATNLVIFYEGTAIYLHGASDDKCKNLMAPYLLQWKQIQDAKKAGCAKYDFGGIKSSGPTPLDRNDQKGSDRYGSWSGITRFKTGFSPNTKPLEFPGSYDIVISPGKYKLYRIIQKIKGLIK